LKGKINDLTSLVFNLTKEKTILINTLDNQNELIEELKEVNDDFFILENQNQNLHNSLLAILTVLKEKEGTMVNPHELGGMLSDISNVVVNSLMGESIKEHFGKKVKKGNLYAQEIYEVCDQHEQENVNEINISFFDQGYGGNI